MLYFYFIKKNFFYHNTHSKSFVKKSGGYDRMVKGILHRVLQRKKKRIKVKIEKDSNQT